MNLSALAGNQRVKEQLSQQEGGRGLSHAYIISGPAGSGRHTRVGFWRRRSCVPEGRSPADSAAPARRH